MNNEQMKALKIAENKDEYGVKLDSTHSKYKNVKA